MSSSDYRNTKYSCALTDIDYRKQLLDKKIRSEHKRAKGVYEFVRKNEEEDGYKRQFLEVYDNKCGYCGVSNTIISNELFEVDHFIHKKHSVFIEPWKANEIENLVCSCRFCNRKKGSFDTVKNTYKKLHPDEGKINEIFERDYLYYIKISKKYSKDSSVIAFYKKLKMSSEVHRLDYLLMNLKDFLDSGKIENKALENNIRKNIIDKLQYKRNTLL